VANLRDGVTVVPASTATRERLAEVMADVESVGGSAWLFEIPAQAPAIETKLIALFDRAEAYDALASALTKLRREATRLDEAAARRQLRQIERDFESITATDFFRGSRRMELHEELDKLRASLNRWFSPEEPLTSTGEIVRCDPKAFRGQQWATRKRLWVDRAASEALAPKRGRWPRRGIALAVAATAAAVLAAVLWLWPSPVPEASAAAAPAGADAVAQSPADLATAPAGAPAAVAF